MKKIEMILKRTNTGYSAYAKNYPVATTGKDLNDLKSSIVELLNLFFEENRPMITEKDIKVTLDLAQFFEFYKVINAKAFSDRICMNQSLLAQYISGKKKPSKTQSQRILRGIQEIGKELTEIRFLL